MERRAGWSNHSSGRQSDAGVMIGRMRWQPLSTHCGPLKGPLGGALVDDVPRLKRVKLRRPASGSLKAERARLLIRINVRTWAQRQQKTRLKAFLDCGCRFFCKIQNKEITYGKIN